MGETNTTYGGLQSIKTEVVIDWAKDKDKTVDHLEAQSIIVKRPTLETK